MPVLFLGDAVRVCRLATKPVKSGVLCVIRRSLLYFVRVEA